MHGETPNFIDRYSNNSNISVSTEIRAVGAEFSMRTDRLDEADGRFSQCCDRA